MKEEDVIAFREKINKETNAVLDIMRLQNDETFKEYMKTLRSLGNEDLNTYVYSINRFVENMEPVPYARVIEKRVPNLTYESTNGIYVCLESWNFEKECMYFNGQFEPAHPVKDSIDSPTSEQKLYIDIESLNKVQLSRQYSKEQYEIWKLIDSEPMLTIDEFEKKHIVLNPYNTFDNQNGLEEVRVEFFKNVYELGNNLAVERLLSKYPRINSK